MKNQQINYRYQIPFFSLILLLFPTVIYTFPFFVVYLDVVIKYPLLLFLFFFEFLKC